MSAYLSASAALDRHFLETRCKIIEIAANLDRIDRGHVAQPPSARSGVAPPPSAVASVQADSRLAQIRSAIQVLLESGPGRAEKCQMAFSLPYDPGWKKPR